MGVGHLQILIKDHDVRGRDDPVIGRVRPVANGSVLLGPLSPRSMYARPGPVTFGFVLLIQAPAQVCHCLLDQIPAASSFSRETTIPAGSV